MEKKTGITIEITIRRAFLIVAIVQLRSLRSNSRESRELPFLVDKKTALRPGSRIRRGLEKRLENDF